MAVVIETTLGDITVDLYLEQRPVSCLNFLKLCKMKYYNYNLFHTIRSGFIAQTGDPSGEGSGGQSIFGIIEGPEKRFFSGEKMPKIRHSNAGLLSMVCTDDMMVGSQFFFTLAPDLDSLDGVHCVIGEVTEGHEVLRKLNEVICDETHRPYQDVRITHTVVLEDPFNNPSGFHAPSRSPSPSAERLKGGRIAPDEELDETQGKSVEEIQEMIEEKEAKARATILEIVGDLPDADIAPPENVLFVCKLNPVTTDEDLEIIFSRFGEIVSCEVIRDKKTGDSLQYAFIEFSDKKSCEEAYFKMDNVLIDDRRIHVDFSQSVSKMRWLGKGRGVQHFDSEESKDDYVRNKQRKSFNQHHDLDRTRYQNDKEKSKYTKPEEKAKNNEDGKNREKDRRYDDDVKERDKEHRSRNHSVERSRHRRESSRDRSTRSNKYSSEENTLKRNSKAENYRDKTEKKDGYNKVRDTDVDSYRSKNQSPARNSNNLHNQDRHKKRDRSAGRNNDDKEVYENKNRYRDNTKKRRRSRSRDNSRDNKISKPVGEKDRHRNSKRLKKEEKHHEPQTPPPVRKETKKKDKLKTKHTDKGKKVKNAKRKRKPSTSSSESDSSESSTSSSESSSSSGSDRKKRRTKKKKKYSSSSSNSSDSTSSSSDSSSETSSSSSDSDTDKKKSKRNGKKKTRKSR